ncbi:hypothetical protein N8I74_12440 [Chitiniphilus purpureus]|uniref:Uncharacterized protein n=1 Tax=Chitiniphilus purpureus TaxID=2981137 RepID=A0ABY6DIH8_9NEIS|nr:hypothetical protein [Chitiniphilus sp. CD1]UXY14127.1 hypothetical protein N8I74_12440 [Chitiniphilus sp. CD1]
MLMRLPPVASSSRLTACAALLLTLGLALLAVVPVDTASQLAFGGFAVLTLFGLKRLGRFEHYRLFFLLLAALLTLRYLYWRTTSTLGYGARDALFSRDLPYQARDFATPSFP